MKVFKNIALIFLIVLMIFSVKVFADMASDDQSYGKHAESLSTIISKFEDGTTAVGIDVSAYQKDIDWAKVADSGVKFAILRCCFRTSVGGELREDAYYRKNIEGALNNGIYVGVYCYSTAINEAEAVEEATFVLNLIRGYDIKYFVAYDFEEFTPKGYRTDNLPIEQINRNATAFITKIREAGYTPCIYGNLNGLRNYLDMNSFASEDVWVAQWYYYNSPNYERYNMFQYTDEGQVPGIGGFTDIDVDYTYYFKYNNIDITPYMFNATYYADSNPDVKNAFGYNESLLRKHYEDYGKREGRTATPVFDPKFYVEKYSDLKAAFGTDYVALYNHFVGCGAKEKRQGSKYFDPQYYLKNNTDVIRAIYNSGTKAIAHFCEYGINESRQGSEEFNVLNYKNTVDSFNRRHIGNNNIKYFALSNGGRPVVLSNADITPYLFDAEFYYNNNYDLQVAFGFDVQALRKHYEEFGKKEGRQASRIFDPKYYVEEYSDLKAAFGTDYVALYNHFVNNGVYEGRSGSEELQVTKYIANYEDLSAEFGPYYSKAIEHYALFGAREGRKGN